MMKFDYDIKIWVLNISVFFYFVDKNKNDLHKFCQILFLCDKLKKIKVILKVFGNITIEEVERRYMII